MDIGQQLGEYLVVGLLGRGGMGEVWRATDTKLGRDVALKVLPADFADDPDRHARFEREARVLASLNHPNIATLYGLEHFDVSQVTGEPSHPDTPETNGPQPHHPITTVHVLVMELAEGEDLSTRIARGQISSEEAVAIALQIAGALEAAHEAGIVHRDLKPANVRLSPDGTVKVLDFGLAKAWETDDGDQNVSMSPTITKHHTMAGVILGTAAYMSPEQAVGIAADRRADIWAFGVVLWEMLTGRQLFSGETVSHVLAAVLKDEIDLDALPESLPFALRNLVSRCLRKKAKQRLQAIGEARVRLEEIQSDPSSGEFSGRSNASDPVTTFPWSARTAWMVAGVLAASTLLLLWLVMRATPQVIKATIPVPPDQEFHLDPRNPGPVAVSPNGRKLAFAAHGEDGIPRLFVRNLDADRAHVLSGTEGAAYPFWSPDSRWLGFFSSADDTLKKIDVTGGPSITLCAVNNAKGGSWSPEGVIVFAPSANSPLHRVSSAGGDSVPVTEIDTDRHTSHRHPRFLPDGKRFLFVARGTSVDKSVVFVSSVESGETDEVLRSSTQVEFASGHLFFVRDRTLMAQPFDPTELQPTGEAVPLAEDILVVIGASLAVFSSSKAGVVSYQSGKSEIFSTLEWVDRAGQSIDVFGDRAVYRTVTLSPDGTRAAAEIVDLGNGTSDIWVYEIDREIRSRFTFESRADQSPVWTPNGDQLIFASNRNGEFDLYTKPLGGAEGVELLLASKAAKTPTSISPDGTWLVFHEFSNETLRDIWITPLGDEAAPRPFQKTEFDEAEGQISPDGRWLAYTSNESGRPEVYVTTFPEHGRRWQVSTNSGVYPQWRQDGLEILFSSLGGQLTSVSVAAEGNTFRIGPTEELFKIQSPLIGGAYFCGTADHQRVLIVPAMEQRAASLLHFVVNWPEELKIRSK